MSRRSATPSLEMAGVVGLRAFERYAKRYLPKSKLRWAWTVTGTPYANSTVVIEMGDREAVLTLEIKKRSRKSE